MRFSILPLLLLSTTAFASPAAQPNEAKVALVPGPGQNILDKIETMWPKLQALLDDMGYIAGEASKIPTSPRKQVILDDINPWWGANGYLFDLLGKLRVDMQHLTQTKDG
ncbi:hypothetical protein BJ508DRAFT_311497 [Ascobolus immersus RN42]|uniref:Uncharacterized protein n=1 Tax=Ascobolus immersus RN42 TaxID=1160509 RepID=A0A3N4HVU9_ASCIM|nr:hypothetical protein BJ508DRAFT_311497 [Ascobolus immersus RN42]